jgi:hypothetical protein
MQDQIKKEFPKICHTADQWYAARYFDSDLEDYADSLLHIFQGLKKSDRKGKGFIADLTKNFHLIMEELDDPQYLADRPKKVTLSKAQVISTYDKFVNYRKDRVVPLTKIVPTYENIIGQNLKAVMDNGKVVIVTAEDKEVKIEEIKTKVIEQIVQRSEEPKILDNYKTHFVSEVADKPYEAVAGKAIETISVENKVSAQVLVDFAHNMPKEINSVMFQEKLKHSITTISNEIPIPVRTKDNVDFVNLTLPRITKNFMNKNSYVHSQDIAKALAKKYECEIGDRSSKEVETEFFKYMVIEKEQRPPNLLFNPSWLEKVAFEEISTYVPIYTGLQMCPWILASDVKFPECKNKESYKQLLSMIIKMAKFYGLWIRGGMVAGKVKDYIEKKLCLTSKRMYGYAIHTNISVWISKINIEHFRESPAFTVKVNLDFFDEDVFDREAVFDEYDGPSFKDMPDFEVTKDRDLGELNEKPKPKRGSNNEAAKERKAKIDRKEKRDRDKKKKAKKKSSSSSGTSSGSQLSSSSDSERDRKNRKNKKGNERGKNKDDSMKKEKDKDRDKSPGEDDYKDGSSEKVFDD